MDTRKKLLNSSYSFDRNEEKWRRQRESIGKTVEKKGPDKIRQFADIVNVWACVYKGKM